MERDGPVYGYQLAERIAERTEGAWRPGAGAVYPALNSLVKRDLARRSRGGQRRLYTITPDGRAFLRRIRRDWMGGGTGPDTSRLWAEISGSGDAGQHLLRHLHRHLDLAASAVEREPDRTAGGTDLRSQLLDELRVAEERIRRARSPSSGRSSRARTA